MCGLEVLCYIFGSATGNNQTYVSHYDRATRHMDSQLLDLKILFFMTHGVHMPTYSYYYFCSFSFCLVLEMYSFVQSKI